MKNPYVQRLVKFLRSHLLMSALIYGSAVAVLAGALWGTFQFVDPLPPSRVTILSGGDGGAYYDYAMQYAEFFRKHGYELEVLHSKGSLDNLSRLGDPGSTAMAALMQGGIAAPEDHPGLESLGGLYFEPVWLFHSKRLRLRTLADLKGRKVAMGNEGSGTNHLVSQLLADNGITAENTTLLAEGASQAEEELDKGRIDALFTIAGIKSDIVERLMHKGRNIRLFSFARAETYVRTHRFLTKLTLPPGGLDLVRNIPGTSVTLLAPTANLVVKEDLHPAMKYLFLLAAAHVHGKGSMFSAPGQFPSGTGALFPLAKEAENFYKSGPPLLMRYLPFQLAITVERLKILLIPLLTLLFPLFKITPPAYRWQIRRRIFKWYKKLKRLDMQAYDLTDHDRAVEMLEELERMDRLVLETSVPLSYTDYIYSLRLHIRMIRRKLERIVGTESEDSIMD